MAVCQNLVPLVNIKIAGKWMFIPLKIVLIGIDPYPYPISITICHNETWPKSPGRTTIPHSTGSSGSRPSRPALAPGRKDVHGDEASQKMEKKHVKKYLKMENIYIIYIFYIYIFICLYIFIYIWKNQ